jgi:hypothetical protein
MEVIRPRKGEKGGGAWGELGRKKKSVAPFELLHGVHAATRLSELFVPPLASGWMWSTLLASLPQ